MKALFRLFIAALCFSANLAWADSARLLQDDVDALKARLEALEQTKPGEEALVTSLFLGDDEIGRTMMTALRKAARRGVRVKILLDGYNNGYDIKNPTPAIKFNSAYIKVLNQENIEIRFFNEPVWHGLRFASLARPLWSAIHRLHIKIFLAGSELISGGRNYLDGYFGIRRGNNRVYKDRDLLLKSAEVLEQAREHFYSLWDSPYSTVRKTDHVTDQALAEAIQNLDAQEKKMADWQEKYKDKPWLSPELEIEGATFTADSIQYGVKTEDTGAEIISLMDHSNESILIDTPFFVPPKALKRAVRRALDRGIKPENITIITANPGRSERRFMGPISYREAKIMDRWGINILMAENPDTMHAKGGVFDRKISLVTSYNWLNRSQTQDIEGGLVIRSGPLADQLSASIQRSELQLTPFKDIQYDSVDKRFAKLKDTLTDENLKAGEKLKEATSQIKKLVPACLLLMGLRLAQPAI